MHAIYALSVALLLCACDSEADGPPVVAVPSASPAPVPTPDEAPSAEPAPEPAPEGALHHFNVGGCAAGAVHGIGPFTERRGAIAVAFDSRDGGLVVRTKDADHLEVRPLDASGEPGEAVVVGMVGARDLKGVHDFGGRYVVVTHALCPESRASNKCLNLRALSAEGEPLGEVLTETTREWMARSMFEVAGDALVVLRSHTYIQPVLERYSPGGDGAITRGALGDVARENEDGIGADAWGLAVDGDRWAALIRDPSGDAERFFLHVAGADEATVIPLPILRRSTGASLAFEGDGLRLLIFIEGETRIARLGLDGSVAEAPRALTADDELAGDRVVPVVTATRRRATFARTDLAGRPIGEALEVDVAGESAAAGDGARFVVAFTGHRDDEGAVAVFDCAAD